MNNIARNSVSKDGDATELHTTDIAIVGGGMVGLTLALLLGKRLSKLTSQSTKDKSKPLSITVLDNFTLPAHNQPSFTSSFDARSTAIAVSSCAILNDADVWQTLAQHVTPITRVHVSDRGHFAGGLMTAAEYQLSALGYVVENAWLGNVLAARINRRADIACKMPATVNKVRANRDGYLLEIVCDNKIEQLQTALLVLADGADSKLRRQLGIEVNQQSYNQSAVIANVQCERAHGGVAYERFTAAGPVAMLPLGESVQNRTCALVWTHPSEQADAVMSWDDQHFLTELQRSFGFRLGRLQRVSRRFCYPLQLQVATEQVRRGLVIVGNAAHFLHPVAGQGFNLALRDCAQLVTALADSLSHGKELGDAKVLESYLSSQQRDQWTTIQLSDRLVQLFSNNHFSSSILRQLGLLAIDAVPPAKQLFARQAMGYSVG